MLGDTDGRSVRPMRGAEGIVHKKVAKPGKRPRQPLIVFLLTAEEAGVLEEKNLSRLEVLAGLERLVRISGLDEDHGTTGQLLEPIRHRLQRVLRIGFAFGPSKL